MAIDAASMMRTAGGDLGPTVDDLQQQQHLPAEDDNQALYQSNRSSSGGGGGGSHSQVLASHHADYILAMALDIYGRRMATVSGDRTVRIWELQADGVWSVAAAWQAHRSAVTAVTWAHPEFGSLLATAGADHDVKIWEEMSHTSVAAAAAATAAPSLAGGSHHVTATARWNLMASLTDARRGMTCVEFAPRQWGLKVATGSSDGSVRIYEAVDIMNLSQWPIAATMAAFDETEGTATSASTSADHYSNNTMASTTTSIVGSAGGGCTCLSWCTGRFDPPTLAVGGSHCVLLYRYSESVRAWQSIWSTSLATDVLDVAWAPNVGRRFHALALVTTDSTVRFLEFSRYSSSSSSSSSTNSNTIDTTSETPITVLSQQDVTVPAWRCQWNVTGTVLAVAGDAGMIQLFKRDGDGHYFSAAKIQGDLSQFATMNAIP
jgi:nucleoporin SEH1